MSSFARSNETEPALPEFCFGLDGWQLESGEAEPIRLGEIAEFVPEFRWFGEVRQLDGAAPITMKWVEESFYDVCAPLAGMDGQPFLDLGLKFAFETHFVNDDVPSNRAWRVPVMFSGRIWLGVSSCPESPEQDPFVRWWVPTRIREVDTAGEWRDVKETQCDSGFAYMVLCRPVLDWSTEDREAAIERRRAWRRYEPSLEDLDDSDDEPPPRSLLNWFRQPRAVSVVRFHSGPEPMEGDGHSHAHEPHPSPFKRGVRGRIQFEIVFFRQQRALRQRARRRARATKLARRSDQS
jgi:hypothetical protein